MRSLAQALEKLGFVVLHLGLFGVTVRGEPDVFERALGIRAIPDRGLVARVVRSAEALRGLVDLVEIRPPPDWHGEGVPVKR